MSRDVSKDISHLVSSGADFSLSLGQDVPGGRSVNVLHRVSLLGKDLDRGVLVDGHGARGDEDLLDSAVLLIDGDHSGLQNCQSRNVTWEDTKSAREGGNINLNMSKLEVKTQNTNNISDRPA